MRSVYAGHPSVITGLGFTVEDNYRALYDNRSAISTESFHGMPATAARISGAALTSAWESSRVRVDATRLEKLFLLSMSESLMKSGIDVKSGRTALVISTTKGNVGELSRMSEPSSRVRLRDMAVFLAGELRFGANPLIVSNACVSGISAIAVAKELIASGSADHAVVTGGDVITDFVISGFLSFRAVSDVPCMPFDADRKGLSLGEGCATLVLSADAGIFGKGHAVEVAGCATSNDANHISGPSRDGSGLFLAVKNAMNAAHVSADDIRSVSAHGTGTAYNDEMESKAFTLASLQNTPLYSLKGSIGHTLGAAGMIESVMAIETMLRNEILISKGYTKCGVPMPLNVTTASGPLDNGVCLKTASGFGGSNAAVVFRRVD